MSTELIATYRNLLTLKDGARVLLRLLTIEDRDRLIDMFAPVSPEDLKYIRDPVIDAETVGRWVDQLDYTHVIPLVAVFQDRLVGDATLHIRKGSARHMGDVRIFLVKEFRRRGLGTHMLRTVVELARKIGLHLLVAEVVADQTKVIQAFQYVGFQIQSTFEDSFIFPDGEITNTVIMTMHLIPREEEF
jgi:RimJ/RimL family protein N-acetyltransferase